MNPNKKIQVMVDHFKFFMCYRSMELSVPEVVQQPPIHVDRKGDKNMKAKLRLKDTSLTKLAQYEDLLKDWNKGAMNLRVKMEAKVTYEDGIWPTRETFSKVSYGDLDVGFTLVKDTSKLRGIGQECHVDVTS